VLPRRIQQLNYKCFTNSTKLWATGAAENWTVPSVSVLKVFAPCTNYRPNTPERYGPSRGCHNSVPKTEKAHVTCKFCTTFSWILRIFKAEFSTLKSVSLLYDPASHTTILAWFYLVCSFVLRAFLCLFTFWCCYLLVPAR